MFQKLLYFPKGSGISLKAFQIFFKISSLGIFSGIFQVHPYHQKMLIIHDQSFEYVLKH